jgi:hypothetical protein
MSAWRAITLAGAAIRSLGPPGRTGRSAPATGRMARHRDS